MALPDKGRYLKLIVAFASKYARRGFGIFVILALIISGYFYGAYSANHSNGKAFTPVSHSNPDQIAANDKTSAKPATKLWVCPMHPDVIRDQPDMCPVCGMDLVEMGQPSAAVPGPGHSHGVHIDTASQQRLGVRLATAKLQTLSHDIHTYGNVVADESLIFNLSAKLEGVIRKLHVNSVGQQVEEGQVIYEIYSPELLKAQHEFIALIKEKDRLLANMMGDDSHTTFATMPEEEMMDIRTNAKKRNLLTEKFLYVDAGNELIEELNFSHRAKDVVQIHAPQSGVVTKIDVHEGSAVKPMDNLYSFTNLSRVLIEVPLYPDQMAWVKEGDEVTVKAPNSGSREIKSRLKIISPMVDNATRTVQARMSVNNPRNQLLIGSFLDVVIHAKPHKALAVPRSAVMRTGKGDLVMLADGEGHFTPAKVDTGIETDDSIEITAGLQAGDQVAVNGQFLLDAAASMSDAAQRMQHDRDAAKH